jgi:hypothetical protein
MGFLSGFAFVMCLPANYGLETAKAITESARLDMDAVQAKREYAVARNFLHLPASDDRMR